jgi:hypothetical protein
MIYGLRPQSRVALCFLLLGVTLVARVDSFEKYVGFYAIVGEKPKDFAIISFDAGRLDGHVIPNHGRVYEFSSAKLHFHTRSTTAWHMDFIGQFLKAPPLSHNGRTRVIEGVLKRFRNGEVAAEARCQFAAAEAGGE